MRALNSAAIVAMVALLSGCGGNGASSVLGSQGQIPTTNPSMSTTRAGFAITLSTKGIKGPQGSRSPKYVSAGTNTIAFSATPASGTTTTATYDVGLANTQPSCAGNGTLTGTVTLSGITLTGTCSPGSLSKTGGTGVVNQPTLSQPCVLDGNPNNERICILYIPATGGVSNHFVVRTYGDLFGLPLNDLLSLGVADATPTTGASTSVTIALQPVLAPNPNTIVQGGLPAGFVVDGNFNGRLKLALSAYDAAGNVIPNTETGTFSTGSLGSGGVVSGTPASDRYVVHLGDTVHLAFWTYQYGSLPGETPCLSTSTSDEIYTSAAAIPTSATLQTEIDACYDGAGTPGADGIIPPYATTITVGDAAGTIGTLNFRPLFVTPSSGSISSPATIVVSQFGGNTPVTVDTSGCPATVANLTGPPPPMATNANGFLDLTLTATGGGTCTLVFNGFVERQYSYAGGSFTVTIP
jgi:hypothetical protein